MGLLDSTKEIIEGRTNDVSKTEWISLKQKLSADIERETSLTVLQTALGLDTGDLLPFEQKKLLFEKIMAIDRTKSSIENFAWWLQLNGGPDWDGLAEELLNEAESR